MKVFCIGLSKTGTTSLTAALRMLGFDAVHWYATRHAFRYVDGGSIDVDWGLFEQHDAFADTPIARIFPLLDARYPGSRFILTVREPERWIRSFAAQFQAGNLDPFSAQLHRDLYGTEGFDQKHCLDAFARHVAAVRSYFAERPGELLEMDITGGDGWGPLCAFLDRPEPDAAFPCRFTRAERTRSLRFRMLDGLRRRLFVGGGS